MNIINEQSTRVTFPIAIICSRFNETVTQELLKGALNKLQQYQFADEDITVVHVPGAVEIPLVAKRLAESKRYQAIVTLGAVIRGETTHYDYVCQMVSEGVNQVSLQYNIPVIFGVLTTENGEQAFDRLGGAHGHKGHDAIDVAVEMGALMKVLELSNKIS